MKIGITGGSGVLGQLLISYLKNKYKVSEFRGDVRSKSQLRSWIKNSNFDYIFHLAAIVPVSKVIRDPLLAYSVNVLGTINLLNELLKTKKKIWFFYASTSHVYKSKNSLISEKDKVQPTTLYGYTKWMAEKICADVALKSNIDLCCGRIFSFYHYKQDESYLFSSARKKIRESKDGNIYVENANNIRDFLKAEDVVKIIYKLFRKKYQGTINIASGKRISIKNFIQKQTKKKINILTNKNYKKSILVANVNKLKKILN
jgi:UDP-glucose 4-epimerase